MDKIRIGNDIIVNWNITRLGKPEDLESKKLKLFLRTGYEKIEISDYIVKDSVITFNFYGKDQVHTGIYVCMLIENDGELRMSTVDSSPAFELVHYYGMPRKTEYPFTFNLSTDITIGDGSGKAEKELIFTNVMGLGTTAYDFIIDAYTNGKIIVDIDEAGKYSVCPHLNVNEGSIEMLFSPLMSNDGITQTIIRVPKDSAPTREELKEPSVSQSKQEIYKLDTTVGPQTYNELKEAMDAGKMIILGDNYNLQIPNKVALEDDTITVVSPLMQMDDKIVEVTYSFKDQEEPGMTFYQKVIDTGLFIVDVSTFSQYNVLKDYINNKYTIAVKTLNRTTLATSVDINDTEIKLTYDTIVSADNVVQSVFTLKSDGTHSVTNTTFTSSGGGMSSFILNVAESDLYQKALEAYNNEYILITADGNMYFHVAMKYKVGDNIVFSYMQGGMGLVDLTIKPDNTTDSNSSNLCVTVDALDNESMTDPLSARQGKLLNDRLTALESSVNKLIAGTF